MEWNRIESFSHIRFQLVVILNGSLFFSLSSLDCCTHSLSHTHTRARAIFFYSVVHSAEPSRAFREPFYSTVDTTTCHLWISFHMLFWLWVDHPRMCHRIRYSLAFYTSIGVKAAWRFVVAVCVRSVCVSFFRCYCCWCSSCSCLLLLIQFYHAIDVVYFSSVVFGSSLIFPSSFRLSIFLSLFISFTHYFVWCAIAVANGGQSTANTLRIGLVDALIHTIAVSTLLMLCVLCAAAAAMLSAMACCFNIHTPFVDSFVRSLVRLLDGGL